MLDDIQRDLFISPTHQVDVKYLETFDLGTLADILPRLLLVGFFILLLSRMGNIGAGAKNSMFGGMSSIGKIVKPGDIRVKFRYGKLSVSHTRAFHG